jgi:glycosyltransferase involved in cell wall biosynthesis
MNVSLVGPSYIRNDAISHNITNKARYFLSRSDEVRIFFQHRIDDPPPDVAPLVSHLTVEEALYDGVYPGIHSKRLDFLFGSDLLIVDYPVYYELAHLLRFRTKGITVFDYHGITPIELWGTGKHVELLKKGIEHVPLGRLADFSIAHSEFTRTELSETYGFDSSRIIVQPYMVSLDRFTPGPRDEELVRKYAPEGGPVLLYVGRMAGNKRIGDLVQGLSEIKKKFPNVKLLLVGDHRSVPYKPHVFQAYKMGLLNGLWSNFAFTGPVDHAELPRYFNTCDLYVTASLHEGFCIPVVEALACGKPVVAASAAALPGTVGPGGLLFEPKNVGSFAGKVIQILESRKEGEKGLYRSLSRGGLGHVAEFSEPNYRKTWDGILSRIFR